MSTKEAFADAVAGVAGSLVAMLAFYPMEVLKTNRQAGIRIDNDTTNTNTDLSKRQGGDTKNERDLSRSDLRVTLKWIQTLFRGLHYKTAHTIASSFLYFFISSWIQSKHKTLSEQQWRGLKSTGRQEKFHYKPSTSTRLLLSAVAAMLNVLITLPLDVLAAQSQTRPRSLSTSESKSIKGNEEHDRVDNLTGSEGKHNNNSEEKKEERESICRKKVEPTTNIPVEQQELPLALIKDNKSTIIPESFDSEIDSTSIMEAIWHDAAERSQDLKQQDSFLTSKEEEEEDNYGDGDGDGDERSQSTNIDTKKGIPLDDGLTESESNSKQNQTKPLFRIDTMTQPFPKQLLQSLSVATNKQSRSQSNKEQAQWKEYWRGIRPALLLCSNPSIHFTVFDVVKEWVFAKKLRQSQLSSSKEIQTSSHPTLNMMESFALGMIAKFAATLATYPLIRAKVALMVSSRSTNSRSAKVENCDCQSNNSETMMGLLNDMFRKGGVKELYKGCNLQLVHTLLKSALLMMVKEKIQEITRRLLLRQ